jgi:hypothetical protein
MACRDGLRRRFNSPTSRPLGPADVVNVAGTATFRVEPGADPLTVKISWVIIREDFDWKIVSHHVSSKAPLI